MQCPSILLLFLMFVYSVWGHGMVLDPVSRSSRWRYNNSALLNYEDNQLFCGGASVQWDKNNGKCGWCGDNYADPEPRANELGGTFGEGIIVDTYIRGGELPVSVAITANHLGSFTFKLCNLDKSAESESCFDLHPLRLTNGDDKFILPHAAVGLYAMTLQLPNDLACNHCVLQWTYRTANSWGVCENGTGALGCGPQEHFRTCSDIRILDTIDTKCASQNDAPMQELPVE